MRHSGKKLSKISGGTPDNCPFPECSFARVSRKARAFSFSQNQRSIAWQAFPEGAWFSHEGSMNSAGVLVSKYGTDVSHTQVGLYGEMGHDVREKTGEGSRLDLKSGGIQQKRADLAQAWLCVPGAVHSGGRFPRGLTPRTMAPPSMSPNTANIGSITKAMVPFGCPRYRGIVNPSGLCILGLASAEGLNLLLLMPVAKAIVRNSCTSACSESRLGALRRAFLLSIRHVRTGITKPFVRGRLQPLPPRSATWPTFASFMANNPEAGSQGFSVHPLIACLDGGLQFIRKRKSACCGESPTAPILVENLSPAWCPGRSRNKTGGCTSLMKHGTVNLSNQ